MISIDKTKVTKPQRLSDKKMTEKLLNIKDLEKPGKKVTSYNHKEIRDALLLIYQCGKKYKTKADNISACKCAYCETKISRAAFKERIDHFRPKDTIKTIDVRSIQQIEQDKPYHRKLIAVTNPSNKEHRGYFWLGYEWTNLIPTCSQCNLKKSNIFPLENEANRVSDDLEHELIFHNNTFEFSYFRANSVKLKLEAPLLLNPELDIVEKHLLFHGNGEIEGLTKRGKVTIAVYNLNRNDLIHARKDLIMDIFEQLIYALEDLWDNPKAIQNFFNRHVQRLDQSHRAYSRLGYFIKYEFNTFITTILSQHKEYEDLIFIVENEYRIWKNSWQNY